MFYFSFLLVFQTYSLNFILLLMAKLKNNNRPYDHRLSQTLGNLTLWFILIKKKKEKKHTHHNLGQQIRLKLIA